MSARHFGKYELRERLGLGGMAEVWKAFDPQLERYVAIKYLLPNMQADPHILERFIREARVVASLRHPNIVHINEFDVAYLDTDHPIPYMVMNYIEGQTLKNYMDKTSAIGKYPSANEVVQLFASISKAVDYAHQHGVIHRDIKPANILLDEHNTLRNPMGEPILGDFGILKMLGTPSGTLTNALVGTLDYLSPEQASSSSNIDGRADIYSLGIILYEMFTGRTPFRDKEGDMLEPILFKTIHDDPPPPDYFNPHISLTLSKVILRCLAKNPGERFPTAFALTKGLAEAVNINVSEPREVDQRMMGDPTYADPLDDESPTEPLSLNRIPASTAAVPPLASVARPPAQSPIAMSATASHRRRNILLALLTLLLIAGIGFGLIVHFPSFQPNTQPNTCPSADKVAQLMNLLQGSVQKGVEQCNFVWGSNAGHLDQSTSQAHCPAGDGPTSIDMVPTIRPPQVRVIECSGNDSAILPGIYSMTIRFELWEPSGSACQLIQNYRHQNIDVQGPQFSGNLLTNGSFEQGPGAAGWAWGPSGINVQVYQTSDAKDGKWWMQTNTQQANSSIYQDVQTASSVGHCYIASIWVRTDQPIQISGSLDIWGLDPSSGVSSEHGATNFTATSLGWTQVTAILNITKPGHTRIRFQVYYQTLGVNLDLDEAVLVKSVG